MSYDIDTGRKWMNARKLADLLKTRDESFSVECNAVGNLMILDGERKFTGFVDFHGEEVEFKQ